VSPPAGTDTFSLRRDRGAARSTAWLFLFLSLALALAALSARGITAVATDTLLDWDETYYASTTSTAAHGLGFYPYVLGYPQIPDMGGVGYVVSLYVAAYKLLGPHLWGLRLVSFLVSLLAVAGLFVLCRRLHGSAAGLAALAITPSLLIFRLSNSIRLDVFAIAFVAWALVLYSHAVAKGRPNGWHVLTGFAFALGLEVHLHTAAAAFAVGFAYLVRTIADVRRDPARVSSVSRPLAGFVAGYAAGALLFVAANVLPNPQGFFRTAALARLSAADSQKDLNLTAPMDSSRLARTFLSPVVIARKEMARYTTIAGDMSWWEILLWLCGLTAFVAYRRSSPPFPGRTLLVGALLGGGIVFNGSSPLYFSAILPFFVPALATLVTHGTSRRPRVTWVEAGSASAAVLLLLSIAIVPAVVSRARPAMGRLRASEPRTPPAIVDVVKAVASPACILAGPTDLYAEHFMLYPRFVGTRKVEVLIGSTFYDLQNRIVTYWHEKRPDIVFGSPDDGLADYLADEKYVAIGEGVWRKPANLSEGCRVATR
jgi:4-amino-4-deoxy-L-arabinose transferase-like glycosyltransferase